jgi:hypothetical protein
MMSERPPIVDSGNPDIDLFALQHGVHPLRFPYLCCEHCPCGTPDSFSMTRDGHDERCDFGCNDSIGSGDTTGGDE